jgi:hypothetical protein
MSLSSRTALENALAVIIGLMAVELVVRSAFTLSLAAAVIGHIVH